MIQYALSVHVLWISTCTCMAKDVYIGHVMMSDCAVFLACKKLILNTQSSFALDQLLQTALSYSYYPGTCHSLI